MFESLGKLAAKHWLAIVVVWIVLCVGLRLAEPSWKSIVEDGEFRYLPVDMPSRKAQEMFLEAFSRDFLGSSVVVVVSRERGDGLTDGDRDFIENVLKPRLEEISREKGGFGAEPKSPGAGTTAHSDGKVGVDPQENPIVAAIRTQSDEAVGHLLQSSDKKASLVIIELTTEFTEERNVPLIQDIEDLVTDKGKLFAENLIPGGLSLKLSGTATVGRDMKDAEAESASATETWTVLLVVVLLVLIYRAPVLAFIPLITVAASVSIAISILSFLSLAGYVHLFSGIEVYVTVVLYGAGVDFCVFLMARYKEELDAGASYPEAVAEAVKKVGAAITASAGTTTCGIGMMYFAEFGKFKQAGIAMSSSLFIVLCASLTLAPALLRMSGRWAFWPNMLSEQVSIGSGGWLSPTTLLSKLMAQNSLTSVWDKIGRVIMRRPMTVWLSCIALMMPFAVYGALNFNNLSYGLLSELSDESTSVKGAMEVQEYFPAGETAPVTTLLINRNVDFADKDTGIEAVRDLTARLVERKEELGVDDIRSVSHPLGIKESSAVPFYKRGAINKRAPEYYVSDKGELSGHVTRIDFVLENDPFSAHSMQRYDELLKALGSELIVDGRKVRVMSPELVAGNEYLANTELQFIGATANIYDLKNVTNNDQKWVNSLVVLSVFLVLVALLRRIAICAYLLVTVLFSYLVTLGVTFALFWWLDPEGFAGLDWKVPMFLFTILIAVGEDYNIYLITRIEEEQEKYGMVKGVPVALSVTGGIISSCGLIMAGTFASLMSGTLEGMIQLGFALAFGVLLDTFVVRPILVPAYLVALHSGRFGVFGKILGARYEAEPKVDRTPVMSASANSGDISHP